MKKTQTIINRIINFFWLLFLNGLFTILPITLTIGIITLTFKFVTQWLEPIQPYIPHALSTIPYAEVILVITVIFLIGSIMRIFILRTIIHTIEKLIFKIPLIRPVYRGIKQLTSAFSMQDKMSFKKVILVEFPRKGIYSLGFLTSELATEMVPNKNETFYNIFIPTTPNPTSGYFIIVPVTDVQIIDITRQEAMAMIISGGIIQPDQFQPK